MQTAQESAYLTTEEAGQLLRRCPAYVREMARRKQLPSVRLTPGGRLLIPRAALEEHLARLATAAEPLGAALAPA